MLFEDPYHLNDMISLIRASSASSTHTAEYSLSLFNSNRNITSNKGNSGNSNHSSNHFHPIAKIAHLQNKFRDYHDPEVDRLYNTSPPLSEQNMLLDMDFPSNDKSIDVCRVYYFFLLIKQLIDFC